MTSSINTPAPLHRWKTALFFTALLTGAALAVSGIAGWRKAAVDGERMTRARVLTMVAGFQKHLRARGRTPADLAAELFDIYSEQGLHRIAVYGPGDRLLHSYGRANRPFDLSMSPPDGPSPAPRMDIAFLDGGRLAHVTVEMPPPPRMGRRDRPSGRGGLSEVGPPGRLIRMELVPHEAMELRSRALSMMLINLFAALLFGAAAVLFRHMAQKQEQLREQLSRDRELRTLGEMSAVLGHEIRNTIASLKGHAQLLSERDDAKKDPAGPRAILSDIDYLQGLSEQILDAAKAGSLRLERVYLDDLAEGAVALAGCDPVEVIVQGEPSSFMLDRRRMQQALINLLRNARQAGADSPIRLRMHGARNRLTVEVADENGGIREDVAERVFEPFFTTRARGTGLGLFIARRAAEDHGGTIRLDNRPGVGASFIIEIPPDRKGTP